MTTNTDTTAASGAASLGPLNDRAVLDAIRSAYDLGYNDARNARTVPGDSAPGYNGRDVERDHGGALIHALSQRLAAPAASEAASLGAQQAELAGAETANNHLSAMVDELRALLAHAMRVMKELHSAAKPDEEQEDCPPIISAEAFARFVNQNAALRYAIHKSGHDLPTTPALAAPAAQPCQTCADRADGFYGSYAPDCPTHTAAPAAQEAEPAAVVAHCLLRRNSYGKWVHDAKHWADGPAPAELVRDVEKYPDHYRIRNAYAEPAPRPQADAGAVAVPEGWRLVPVEPTPGMLSVGAYNVQCDYENTIETIARHAYRAMLAAAPQAPAAPTLNVSEER